MIKDAAVSETFREVCYTCRRARAVCVCAALQPVAPKHRVVFVQHPREARNPIGTVRMAHLQLKGSRIFEGVELATHEEAMRLFAAEKHRSVVLYPAAGARDAETLREHDEPLTIWVLDGTWSQAKKLWRYNPWLHELPAYTLNPKEPGRYRIRREPAPHCLATIEAVQQLLDILTGSSHAQLLQPFDAMIETQLRHSGSSEGRRVRRKIRKTVRRFSFPESCDPARVVLVHAEGSGFVSRSRGGTNELLEWHALRPQTGERFYAAIETKDPVEEKVRAALGLSAPQRPREEVDREWAAFVGDDPCVGWGRYAPALYADAGKELARYFDLRDVLADFLKRRLGYVEDGTERLGLDVAAEPRRGARRLMHLQALFDYARRL